MAVEMKAKPLDKIKKIRSLDEILTRGGQALSVYREQRRGGVQLPSDEEFVRLIEASHFGTAPIIAESLWQNFTRMATSGFFVSPFKRPDESTAEFREIFGEEDRQGILLTPPKILLTAASICSASKIFSSAPRSTGTASRFRQSGRRCSIGSSLTISTRPRRATKRSSGNSIATSISLRLALRFG